MRWPRGVSTWTPTSFGVRTPRHMISSTASMNSVVRRWSTRSSSICSSPSSHTWSHTSPRPTIDVSSGTVEKTSDHSETRRSPKSPRANYPFVSHDNPGDPWVAAAVEAGFFTDEERYTGSFEASGSLKSRLEALPDSERRKQSASFVTDDRGRRRCFAAESRGPWSVARPSGDPASPPLAPLWTTPRPSSARVNDG